MNLKSDDLFQVLSIFLGFFLVAGCSSVAKKGSKALESGDYDTALKYLDEAVGKDPKDAKLLTRRQEARAGWLGNRLLEARAARIGGDLDRAFESLLTVFTNAKEWNTPARGSAVFTLEEETELAWVELKNRSKTWIERGQPIKSFYYLKQYAPVFFTKRTEYESYRKAAIGASQKKCKEFAKENGQRDGFYAEWINKTCLIFGIKSGLKTSGLKKSLYGKMNFELDADSLPAATRTKLRTEIEKNFAISPWHLDGAERILKTEVSAEFIQKLESEGFLKSYHYTEMVEGQPDLVKKEHQYSATRHRQYLWIVLKFQSESEGVSFYKDSERDEVKKEGTSHNEKKPAWDIYPESFQPIDSAGWATERVERLLGKVNNGYLEQWKTLMCKEVSDESVSEQATRCLYGMKADIPAPAKQWLESKTGLTPQQYGVTF